MTHSEKVVLKDVIDSYPAGFNQAIEILKVGLMVFFASFLLALISWVVIAWVSRMIFDFNFGPKSPSASKIFAVLIPVLIFYAAYMSAQWFRSWGKQNHVLSTDLENGYVIEEVFEIVDVMKFIEPEHDGVIFFVKSSENQVIVLYDNEFQSGEFIRQSNQTKLIPKSCLKIIKTLSSDFILNKEFSGPTLSSEILNFNIDPEFWPNDGEILGKSWEELKEIYS